jgi:hypothetical protein
VGGKNVSKCSVVGVNATAAGEREKSRSYSCWKKRGDGTPPHEALSWSFQFNPALPEKKEQIFVVYTARYCRTKFLRQSIKRCEKFVFSTLVKLKSPTYYKKVPLITLTNNAS